MKKTTPISAGSPASEIIQPQIIDTTGYPLRPDEMPSIEELAKLTAALVKEHPHTDNDARMLCATAMRIWRVSRDEVNRTKSQSESYWQKFKSSTDEFQEARIRVMARLTKLNGLQYIERKFPVSWDEAALLS